MVDFVYSSLLLNEFLSNIYPGKYKYVLFNFIQAKQILVSMSCYIISIWILKY